MLWGEDERKNEEREHQISPRSRSNGFPHKEERLIGTIVDLDLLSFPSRICKDHGRDEGDCKLKNVNNGVQS
jgi:hypothetical protein